MGIQRNNGTAHTLTTGAPRPCTGVGSHFGLITTIKLRGPRRQFGIAIAKYSFKPEGFEGFLTSSAKLTPGKAAKSRLRWALHAARLSQYPRASRRIKQPARE